MRFYRSSFVVLFLSVMPIRVGYGRDSQGDASVVAHVGPRPILAQNVVEWFQRLPPFQANALLREPPAELRKVFEDVIVRDALLDLASSSRGLSRDPSVLSRILRAQSTALLRHIKRDGDSPGTIPILELRNYYEAHRAQYEAGEKHHVWRILCATRDEALAVLETAKKDPTVATFTALARDHSIDKATYLRGGNLGFLTLDGVSNESGLRVDPTVVFSASRVADGAFVATPVPEGENFAVVWHRGTVAAVRRSFEEVEETIRDRLANEKYEQKSHALLVELKQRNVHGMDEELIKSLDLP